MSRQIEIRHPSGVWVEWGVPGTPPEGSYPWRYVEEAMTDTKRIVAEETWRADGASVRMERDGHYKYNVYFVAAGDARVRIAACAPEALRMLLEAGPGDGDDCPWCKAGDIGQNDAGHDEPCPWLALMRKAGLR